MQYDTKAQPPATYLKLTSPDVDGQVIFFMRHRTADYALFSNDTRMAYARANQLLVTDLPSPVDPHAPLHAYGRLFPKLESDRVFFSGYVGLLVPTSRMLGAKGGAILEIADPIVEDEAGIREATLASANIYGPEADVILSMLEIQEPRARARAHA